MRGTRTNRAPQQSRTGNKTMNEPRPSASSPARPGSRPDEARAGVARPSQPQGAGQSGVGLAQRRPRARYHTHPRPKAWTPLEPVWGEDGRRGAPAVRDGTDLPFAPPRPLVSRENENE